MRCPPTRDVLRARDLGPCPRSEHAVIITACIEYSVCVKKAKSRVYRMDSHSVPLAWRIETLMFETGRRHAAEGEFPSSSCACGATLRYLPTAAFGAGLAR